MKNICRSVTTFVIMISPGVAIASESDSIVPSAGRLIAAIIVVAMLIYASIFFLKRLMMKSGGKRSESMNVIGSCTLGQRSRLCMVEVAGRVLLLGVTPQQVSSIAEFEPSEIETEQPDSRARNFIRHLTDITALKRSAK
ncbi:MAG: flagellar biosynthetic protein FliO [Bacteroidales bacterium]|nr:flagellar biosynthetic protein FliO [Candidatus Latescibacterota bacterium]